MKKLLLPIFLSFAISWYIGRLFINIFTIIVSIDEITWQWFVMHLQPSIFWRYLLLGIVTFGVGLIINAFIVHIRKLEKKIILRILLILVVMLVAVDQTTQLIVAKHYEAIGVIPLVEGWLEIRAIHVRQLTEYGFIGKSAMPVSVYLIGAGICVVIMYFLFRIIRHICPSKSPLYASLVFLIAGSIGSISSAIFHDMGYTFIHINHISISGISDFYLMIGFALFIQALIVNYKSIKHVKTKDMLPYLRYELGLIKNFVLRQERAKAGGVQ